MGSRIATLQMQARELGRLRSGWYDGSKPVRSNNWVVTSPAEHYIEAAAAEWGGSVEKWKPQGNGANQFRVVTQTPLIDAILPPGDPLSQSLEMWNKGGCARRCDGYTESLSDQPCLCVADWGPQFYDTAPRKDQICKMTTRLNVILPSLPDIGVWRAETHSFYAANEIAAAVDMLRSAAGERALIPVRLRIEQRTRVAKGKTKHFPVLAVELRGATAGQVLEAVSQGTAIEATPARAAIEAARPDYVAQAQAAKTLEEWRQVWTDASAAGHLDEELKAKLTPFGQALSGAPSPTPQLQADTPVECADDGENDDPEELDRVYAAVVENTPGEWDMSRLNAEFAKRSGGVVLNSGTVAELKSFLEWLKGGAK